MVWGRGKARGVCWGGGTCATAVMGATVGDGPCIINYV